MQDDWSGAEKKIARRIYDAALERDLARVMQTFKSMAAAATTPGDMWETEDFLSQSRKSIDRTYQYAYSRLVLLFASLLREGTISKEELAGLSDDKIATIVRLGTM